MFRSPNAGQTSLTLQHATSPRSGYRPPAGHNADGYMMPERVGAKTGGWIQDVNKDIERRGTKGVCTGDKFGGPTCPPGSKRYNLAKTFRKMNKK